MYNSQIWRSMKMLSLFIPIKKIYEDNLLCNNSILKDSCSKNNNLFWKSCEISFEFIGPFRRHENILKSELKVMSHIPISTNYGC